MIYEINNWTWTISSVLEDSVITKHNEMSRRFLLSLNLRVADSKTEDKVGKTLLAQSKPTWKSSSSTGQEALLKL